MIGRPKAAFVGIDAGTTGTTVAIYDELGTELASGYREYPCLYPQACWVEQDLDVVWRGICAATRQAVATADLPPELYRAIGFSSQRGTFALLGRDRRPLGPSIVWNDGRARAYEARFAAALSPERYQDLTGMPISAAWTAAKVAWLRDERPDLFEAARWIVNGQEYFLHLLGAEEWATDPASLTFSGMLDIRRLDWSDEVLALCGLDRDRLPPVGAPGVAVGRLSSAAAELTGLPAGTPLCRGAGDQQCATIGAGAIHQGLATLTFGTATVVVAHLDSPDLVTGRSLFVGGHGLPGMWDLEGAAFASGSCLRWWRDTLGKEEAEEAARSGRSVYAVMVERAAAAPPGANGLLFHPFLQGQVTPHYDTAAKGGFLGLGLNHRRSDLLRALLEGCANEVRMVLDTFQRDLAGGITGLRISGGGARSRALVEILANVAGLPVTLTAVSETTALGAAILGAVGAGHFASAREAVEAMVRPQAEVQPDPTLRALYDEQHELFRAAYEAWRQEGLYQRLYDYGRRHFGERRAAGAVARAAE